MADEVVEGVEDERLDMPPYWVYTDVNKVVRNVARYGPPTDKDGKPVEGLTEWENVSKEDIAIMTNITPDSAMYTYDGKVGYIKNPPGGPYATLPAVLLADPTFKKALQEALK